MSLRRVRRRDFSGHWAYSEAARRFVRVARHGIELPSRLPAPVFALLLAALACVGARGRWPWAVGLGLFMASDWVMNALLPRFEKSYGSPQPATLALAFPRTLFGLLPLPIAVFFQAVGSALAFYGLWIEPHRITVTRQSLRSPKLRPGSPIRILHFGDLHVERITARERQLVDLVSSLRPDLVLFSGDLLNTSNLRDPETWAACRWVLERLSAPLGVFLVAGSSAADPADVMPELVKGMPVQWLREEKVTIEHAGQTLDLIGIGCTHRPFVDRLPFEALMEGRADRFTILLYHTPDLAPDASELGVDLMLSGHTHGGQVRLPLFGALVTSSLYGKAFEMGRYEQEGMTLYVTRGVGLEGSAAPRIRLLCPPEIVLWELDGAA